MLNSTDKDYIAKSMAEVYSVIGRSMIFTPLSPDPLLDKTGKKLRVYDPTEACSFNGVFTDNLSYDKDLSKKAVQGIIDGNVKIITSSIPYDIKKEDAIDIGGKRYLIVGFDSRIEMEYIFTCAFVTAIEKL